MLGRIILKAMKFFVKMCIEIFILFDQSLGSRMTNHF